MRLAIIASQDFEDSGRKGQPSLEGELQAAAWDAAALEQTMAIAKFLRDGSRFEPWLLCREGSPLATEAAKVDLPFLALRSGKHPLDSFRLWRWQKKAPNMLILGMGAGSLKLATRLLGMRKKNSTPFVASFLLRPPALERREAKILARASLLLCGSAYIVERLAIDMDKYARLHWPGSAIVEPGIDYERYTKGNAWHRESGRNFIFGMGESLSPKSGALLIIRAMSALWQKEDLPPFEVRMFGAGARIGEILEEAKTLGVISRLSILSQQDLARTAGLCDAWLAPGAASVELPTTLGAGFAAALPVICTQSELHKERLEGCPPQAAIRVEENNPQKMARAMIAVMNDERLCQKLIYSGESILDKLGLARMSREVLALLESVASDEEKKPQQRKPPQEDVEIMLESAEPGREESP